MSLLSQKVHEPISFFLLFLVSCCGRLLLHAAPLCLQQHWALFNLQPVARPLGNRVLFLSPAPSIMAAAGGGSALFAPGGFESFCSRSTQEPEDTINKCFTWNKSADDAAFFLLKTEKNKQKPGLIWSHQSHQSGRSLSPRVYFYYILAKMDSHTEQIPTAEITSTVKEITHCTFKNCVRWFILF